MIRKSIPYVAFSLILLTYPAFSTKTITAKAKITRKVCDQILTRHVPADDVTYKPGVDANGDSVVSADVDNAMKLDLPDEVAIPIKVDLGKYYREPTSQLTQNFANLTTNQQTADSAQQTFASNFATAETQNKNASTNIDEIKENTTDATVTSTQFKAQFDALAANISSITTALSNNTAPATSTLTQLQKNVSLLNDRINNNPLEKDLTIIQENQKFLSSGVSTIQQTQSNITNNTRLISETQDLLTKATGLLSNEAIQTKLGTTNLTSAQSTFSTLQTNLTALSSDTTNTTTSAALSGLISSFNTLNSQQIANYNKFDNGARYAEVGEVKVNILSGKITFNGKPLTDPEREKIVVKCREIYGKK